MLLKNNGTCRSSGAADIAVIGQTASNTPTGGISAASVCAYTAPGVPCTPTAPLDSITARAAVEATRSSSTTAPTRPRRPPPCRQRGRRRRLRPLPRGRVQRPPEYLPRRQRQRVDRCGRGGQPDGRRAPDRRPGPDAVARDVEGVLEVWYAGEEMGPAIAALLWGDVTVGQAHHTFPAIRGRLPTAGVSSSTPAGSRRPARAARPCHVRGPSARSSTPKACTSATGGTTKQDIQPLFPFGYGLSYTSF